MSAFAPYKRVSKSDNGTANLSKMKRDDNDASNGFIQFPMDLTSVLLGLPVYQGTTFAASYVRNKTEESQEKKEKFFIKNILKSEDALEKQRAERTRRKFEEEASKMETIVSNLGKSDDGHRCIYCGKIYSRKYGLKIHIR